MSRLILLMIDGIGADHFERVRGRLPHLDRLARDGAQVAGVSPEMCGTSAPGRTSIIAGVPPSEHGIYGIGFMPATDFAGRIRLTSAWPRCPRSPPARGWTSAASATAWFARKTAACTTDRGGPGKC